MRTLQTKSVSWHHLQNPSSADLDWIRKSFSFHELVLAELTRPTMRPKVETYDGYLYLVLHFPLFNPGKRKTHGAEIDFLLTQDALISVAYEPIQPLDELLRVCLSDESCRELYASRTPAHLLVHLLGAIYAFLLRELDHVEERITQIEESVFSSESQAEAVIEELSLVRHDLIDFRRAVKPHQSMLESLTAELTERHGNGLRHGYLAVIGEYMKVWHFLENLKETIDGLYENNATVLQIRQNESMRVVAIMALFTFPLSLFAALFSMETVATPLVGHPYDFWIIVGIMAIAAMGMLVYFKRKRWL